MILFAFFGAVQLAQPTTTTIEPPPTPVVAATIEPAAYRLPALTPLRLRLDGEVSSKTHKTGDKVVIILAEPLRVSETLAIPAGTRGVAEVLHAAKSGMGGKPGELLLAARQLDLSPDIHIPLRSFKLGPATGKNQQGVAMGMAVAGGGVGGIASMFITGGSARVAVGSEAFAKTAADVEIPLALLQPIASPEKAIAATLASSPLAPPAAPAQNSSN